MQVLYAAPLATPEALRNVLPRFDCKRRQQKCVSHLNGS
jgi:hypothetical protein